jgi:hypothetical protein
MKRILTLLLLCSVAVFGAPIQQMQTAAIKKAAGGGGGSPTQLYDSNTQTADAWGVGTTDANYYGGHSQFVPGANTTITKFVWNVSKSGDVSGKFFICRVYTDSGGNHDLGSFVGSSDVVAGTAFPVSGIADVDFVCSTPISLTGSTTYNITLSPCDNMGADVAADAVNAGAANHVSPGPMSGGLTYFSKLPDGVNQFPTTFMSSHDLQFEIWGTTP